MSCKTARTNGRHFKKFVKVLITYIYYLGRVKISNLYLPPVPCSVMFKFVQIISHHPLYTLKRFRKSTFCFQYIGDKMARLIDTKVKEFYKERGHSDEEIEHFMLYSALEVCVSECCTVS